MTKRREWKNRIRACLSELKIADSVYTAETEKPEAEQDADLIEECLETMSYLHDTIQSLKKQLSHQSSATFFRVPAIRRIGIIAIALILIVVFFAATPIGRSIAENVYRHFAAFIDKGTLVIHPSDREPEIVVINNEDDVLPVPEGEADYVEQDESDDTADYVYLNSFDEFTEAMGKTPFVLPLPVTELFYVYDDFLDYLDLYAAYEVPNGKIVTFQIWCEEDLFATTSTGFKAYDPDGTLFYSIEEDGSIACVKILEDSVLTVSSQSTYSLEDVIGLLDAQ